ncbi:MAG: hypothetical protein Q9160_005669 [Pyrenula sp. 1 TL-2023]
MSAELWRYFLEDDLENFRRVLARAGFVSESDNPTTEQYSGKTTAKIGSPADLATSPQLTPKARKGVEPRYRSVGTAPGGHGKSSGLSITRADINSRDSFGRTLLHYAATLTSENAIHFVQALLSVPFLDLYVQDLESGWTALHRALYFGNIGVAQALMLRDIRDITDYTTSGVQHTHAGGLIKIKDHEGNSPFEVFGQTVAARDLRQETYALPGHGSDTDSSSASIVGNDEDEAEQKQKRVIRPRINLSGDEVFAFGSNKNLTLGLGDEDDRAYPERQTFSRPKHLLHHFHDEQLVRQRRQYDDADISSSIQSLSQSGQLPASILSKPIVIQDVIMSKLHTAVLTNDPESNLFVCGFGPGGRLGLGDETTRFRFVCVETGSLTGKKITTIALGQDHSIAVSHHGEVFTWGSNKSGQLGYALPKPTSGREMPVQTLPRQLFGAIKKEVIVGAAASAIHSAIFTTSALYTFGKNIGQLGLMDADARSLECQITPRRIGVSLLQSPIQAVSAIDRATTVLLESHDVIVLTHYGWTKVVFQLEGFTNYFLQGSSTTQYNETGNFISKITSNGDTICALSSFGEVFTVAVSQAPESGSTGASTTNPTKAKNALPTPTRVWSIRKSHMAARDVAVGQSGSIILCTDAGSVWRKEKRAKVKGPIIKGEKSQQSKDYKFVRIPSLTRAIAVRSNGYGAFSAVRKDTTVTRDQIFLDPPNLWNDLLPLLSFKDHRKHEEDSDLENPRPRFWVPLPKQLGPADIKKAMLSSDDIEADMQYSFGKYERLSDSTYNVWIASNLCDVRIPAHSSVLAARSGPLRSALAEFSQTYYFSIPDLLAIEYGKDGQVQIQFEGADFLTLLNIVFFAYTENVIDVWHHTQSKPQSVVKRYRHIRLEVMKIANRLDMKSLERAARLMTEPSRCLLTDMEQAYWDEDFYRDADMLLQLADGAEVKGHSSLLCTRCPFFEGLFHGRTGGKWLASRQGTTEEDLQLIKVDLKHVNLEVFNIVLRHLYADTGEEIFDDVVTQDLDEYTDFVIEVMSVANELMIDRLAQICQKVLGRFVTTRNVCHFVNAVGPCSVTEFKQASLEYICLNLEAMLENRLLEDLDEDLLAELDEVVQENQLATMPFVRSGRIDEELFEQYPQLPEQLEAARQVRIDSMRLQSRRHEDEERSAKLEKFRIGSFERSSPSLDRPSKRASPREKKSPKASPRILPDDVTSDVPFEMDEDQLTNAQQHGLGIEATSPSIRPRGRRLSQPFESLSPGPSSVDTAAHSLSSKSPILKTIYDPPVDVLPQPDVTTTGFSTGPKAWATAPSTNSHADLKEIMAQTSTSRQSNLTMAINARDSESKQGFGIKLSQKERKKQHQKQQQDKQPSNIGQSQVASEEPSVVNETPQSKSPWQTPVKPKSRPSLEVPKRTSSTSPRPMTLRQTVAGTPSTPNLSKPIRSVSTPVTTTESRSTSRPSLHDLPNTISSSNASPGPTIQSIRHMAPPSSSSYSAASTSLAAILEQQYAEKTAIHEASTAKRSLQDIQTEQEFQEWWDKEEARIREEARRHEDANSRGRGKGKRGRARTSRKGKDEEERGGEDIKEPKDNKGGSKGSARGRSRGERGERGERGKPRASRGGRITSS